jgi:DNA polymerase alpha subunit A
MVANDPKTIRTIKDATEPPPLTIMCINLRTVMNSQKKANEVVIVTALIYHDVSMDTDCNPENIRATRYVAIRQLGNVQPFPLGFQDHAKQLDINMHKTERSLLSYLMAIIHRIDPDVLVGHNFVGFDLDVLLHRMKDNRVDAWSKIGRLRRTVWPKLQMNAGGMGDSTAMEKTVVSGRLMCDTYLAARVGC